MFYVLVKSYSSWAVYLQRIMKKGLLLRLLRSPLITYLITLRLEKRRYCFGKKSGKSLEFWIQKSVGTLVYLASDSNNSLI